MSVYPTKWIVLLVGLLFLAGCCNGSGPGPRAYVDVQTTVQQQS